MGTGSVFIPAESIGGHMFSSALALFLNDFYREKGLDVWASETVVGLENRGRRSMSL